MTAIRRPGTASAAVLIALSLSVATAHAIAPDWSRRAGLDVWNLSALERQYQSAAEHRADIDAEAERAASRRLAANQIAAKLTNEPHTLPTAADELAEVFQYDPGVLTTLAVYHTAARTERHLFARHAIDRVSRLLADEPARRTAVLARLEKEYRAMYTSPEAATSAR